MTAKVMMMMMTLIAMAMTLSAVNTRLADSSDTEFNDFSSSNSTIRAAAVVERIRRATGSESTPTDGYYTGDLLHQSWAEQPPAAASTDDVIIPDGVITGDLSESTDLDVSSTEDGSRIPLPVTENISSVGANAVSKNDYYNWWLATAAAAEAAGSHRGRVVAAGDVDSASADDDADVLRPLGFDGNEFEADDDESSENKNKDGDVEMTSRTRKRRAAREVDRPKQQRQPRPRNQPRVNGSDNTIRSTPPPRRPGSTGQSDRTASSSSSSTLASFSRTAGSTVETAATGRRKAKTDHGRRGGGRNRMSHGKNRKVPNVNHYWDGPPMLLSDSAVSDVESHKSSPPPSPQTEVSERDRKSCAEMTCANGGVCIETDGTVRCRCRLGTVGMYCERESVVQYPKFRSTGYIAFPVRKYSHASKEMDLRIEFRPDSGDGLLLYSADDPSSVFDFYSVSLTGSRLDFRFDCGFGSGLIRTKNSVLLGQWNTLYVRRDSLNGYVQLNDGPIAKGKFEQFGWTYVLNSYGNYQWNYIVNNRTKFIAAQQQQHQLTDKSNFITTGSEGDPLDQLDTPQQPSKSGKAASSTTLMKFQRNMFLGGHPTLASVADKSNVSTGFIGCVRRLELNGRLYDMRRGSFVGDALYGIDVDDCGADACNNFRCDNDARCAVVGADTPVCMCPLGTGGRTCQAKIEVQVPSFGDLSYLQFIGLRRSVMVFVDIVIVFKPEPVSTAAARPLDGLLLYNGYGADGSGDFLSVSLNNGYVEFRYDLGSGSALLRSVRQVSPNEWHTVHATRQGRTGRLEVDDQLPVEGTSNGVFTQLTLALDLFIGGHRNFDEVARGAHVRQGFRGCIQKVAINGHPLRLADDAVSGVNVNNCIHPCTAQPPLCQNGGRCVADLDRHTCSCATGFNGDSCQDKSARYRYRYRYRYIH